MKLSNEFVHDGTRRGPWWLAVAGAMCVGMLALGGLSSDGLANQSGQNGDVADDPDDPGNDTPPADPGSGGTFSIEDEYVGTLPIDRNGDGDAQSLISGFFLQGPESTIRSSFVGASGNGFLRLEEIPDEDGDSEDELRVSFSGRLSITLDISVLACSQTELGVYSAPTWGATLASAMTQDGLLLVEPIPDGGSLAIPYRDYMQGGLLEDDGVNVVTLNRLRGRDLIGVSRTGGLLEVSQGLRPQR